MNERLKNIISIVLAILIVGFICFAVLYWIVKQDLRGSIELAVAAALGGALAPHLVKFFKKGKNS